jgi:predicted Zn-dependent peptidase
VYTATGKETQDDALRLIVSELEQFVASGISSEELARAKLQVASGLLLGLESTMTRMNRLALGELCFGRASSPEEAISAYEAVTADDITRLASNLLSPARMSFSAVGGVRSSEQYSRLLGLGAVLPCV